MYKNYLIKNKALRIILRIFLIITIIVILLILNGASLLTASMVKGRAEYGELENAGNYGLTAEILSLETEDEYSIIAYDVPVPESKGYVIIVSGIYSPSVTAFFSYSRMFSEMGYSTLLIEMRGHGGSDGDRVMLGYTEERDVNAAVDYIKMNNSGNDFPIVMMGTSMGASVAINAAAGNSGIDGVISQSAYSSWEENMADQFEKNGVPRFIARAQIPFTRLYLAMRFGWKDSGNTSLKSIAKLGNRPVLLMHSTEDSQVIFENYIRLKEAGENIIPYVVEGDKHFILENDKEFSNPELNQKYYKVINAFLAKFAE